MTPRFVALVALFFVLVAAVAAPLGRYLARVFAGENRASARALGPVERIVYRLAGVDPGDLMFEVEAVLRIRQRAADGEVGEEEFPVLSELVATLAQLGGSRTALMQVARAATAS
mgnify:CR=1 FL=1